MDDPASLDLDENRQERRDCYISSQRMALQHRTALKLENGSHVRERLSSQRSALKSENGSQVKEQLFIVREQFCNQIKAL